MKKLISTLVIASLSYPLITTLPAAAQTPPPTQTFQGPVSVKGKVFVTKKAGQPDTRFMIRGVALADTTDGSDEKVYDMLTNANFPQFESNILPKLKELNVNTIRVYVIDPTQPHDLAMNALKQAGIYVTLELASPKYGENVNRINPQYPASLFQRYASVVDAMAPFENTLSFSLGNEVVFPGNIVANVDDRCKGGNNKENNPTCIRLANKAISGDAAILKSLARDMKAYMISKKYRAIPVGVSMQNAPAIGLQYPNLTDTATVAQYYACGDDPNLRMDFVAINVYDYQNAPDKVSAYDSLVTNYNMDRMPVPIYFSETGGGMLPNRGVARNWGIISKTYGLLDANEQSVKSVADRYINDLSGEIAFMLLNFKEQSGLYDHPLGKIPVLPKDRENLAQQFAKVRKINLPIPTNVPLFMACPTNFNPALVTKPYIAPTETSVAVTVNNNFGNNKVPLDQLVLVQNTKQGPKEYPVPTNNTGIKLTLTSEFETYLQQKINSETYNTVCKISPNVLKEGAVIDSPQREWGGMCLVNGK